MGRSVYSNGFIKDNDRGPLEMLNSPKIQGALRATGEKFIEAAKFVFDQFSRHDDTPPVEYKEHFGIRDAHHGLVKSIEVFNDDPTAEWVEFGSHAGGETRILRYRVFGRAADALEALGRVDPTE